MGHTIKTPLKMFMIFLVYQILLNFFILVALDQQTLSDEREDYLLFVQEELKLFDISGNEVNTITKGNELLTDIISFFTLENLFTEGIIDSFFGILKLFADLILFVIEIVILILQTPSIMMNILLYAFIGASTLIGSLTLVVNLGLYVSMYYIILKSRTESK